MTERITNLKYYQELEEMFATKGWKHFEEKCEEIANSAESGGWDLPTGEQLLVNKGVVLNLKWVIAFRESHQAEHDRLVTGEE